MANLKQLIYTNKALLCIAILLFAVTLQACKKEVKQQPKVEYGTFTNPETAFNECKEILNNLSLNLNKTLDKKQTTK
ncbi:MULTISPECIES: hypothetical protein [Myroides]|uniref:Lipoprotein n=1 Tax=Myroides albus TaxID=2562892 RepID=A0A6I3LKA6_9FLAO|nr:MULTISPECIES: hypothetical protein [Myroides]MTG98006.1 hypothetical protein [Myroides albus]MVX34845.1 hypothetical protein [Myroides sp. LoEW2-1]UVD80297.1 hypothetical protein NWE55_03155 [Myroides albus]